MSLDLNKATAGKYLSKKDIDPNQTITLQINDVEHRDLSQAQDGSDVKAVMTFTDLDEDGKEVKAMVVNQTNLKVLMGIYGPSPADYLGKPIIIRHDPTVQNPGHEVVGGLRFQYPASD